MKNGLTLLETLITFALVAVLAGAFVAIFKSVLTIWPAQETRLGMGLSLDQAIDTMMHDLRGTSQVKANYDDEIRFIDANQSAQIYYFYHPNDPYPPTFTNANLLYELKKAELDGGIDGTIKSDTEIILAPSIVSPQKASTYDDPYSYDPPTDLSIGDEEDDFLISVTLTVESPGQNPNEGVQKISLKTMVRPWNLEE